MQLDTTAAATASPVRSEPALLASEDELPRGARIGRYTILERLGVGGMGVVYAARDPELERKIAIKLVIPGAQRESAEVDRIRLLREAQALAKLSHPNVVAVHDTGTHGERVWIAMELIEGQTLRTWAAGRTRPWPEALRVLREAGRGIEAAHAAGLVHRDLKPDNVMVGGDGRVRVMDFGLAHGRAPEPTVLSPGLSDHTTAPTGLDLLTLRLTRVGALEGTPGYMAPEQWMGLEATPAVDQFAWCVTAWELLYGERPFAGETPIELATQVMAGLLRAPPRGRRAPPWLRQVLARGLANEPGRRWPSMTALLAALDRGQARARRRAFGATVVAVAVAVTAIVGLRQWDHARRLAGCAAQAGELDATWNPAARERLRLAFRATGFPQAEWTAIRTSTWLEDQVRAWQSARARACVRVEVEGRWDAGTFDRAEWCLAERRSAIESLIGELTRADRTAVQMAVAAAASLRGVEACVDPELLRRLPAPPTEGRAEVGELRAELARARSLGLAGRYVEGLARLEPARARAEALAWPPLVADARAAEGELARGLALPDRAAAADTAAYFAAARAGAWDVAAQAAAELTFLVGYKQRRPAEARAWAQHAEVAAAHAGDPERLREAQRLNSLAALHYVAGDYALARGAYEQALAIREAALGREHPDVATTLSNLAMTNQAAGSFAAAREQAERALALTVAALGPAHPDVAASLQHLGHAHIEAGELAAAHRLYARALVIQEAALGPDHPAVAESLSNLASAASKMGDLTTAAALHERGLALKEAALGRDHVDIAFSLNGLANVYVEAKAYARAKALYERAIAIWSRSLGPEHPDVARVLGNLANVYAATGDPGKAIALVERALAIKEKALGRDHPNVAVSLASLGRLYLQDRPGEALALLERAVRLYEDSAGRQYLEPEAHFDLARALVATGGDRSRALAEAGAAAEGFREIGAAAQGQLREVEAWLAGQER
ncbi:serine/threonine-protein kinase [Nannocystis bainbridge]|uniref:Serine/threonine-protein kinase n=1 Tax=Nannocystis bainbridge TaxID=2995303 RepID=A0ABT5DSP0_9BACT|nr:serine/threonine-protein kinase [Nannocystis bainbridge]MDC0716571.1 serine/threonine-protein kinase [Nannocystis bainbridge]